MINMKKIIMMLMVLVPLLMLSSCMPEWIEIPPGVWQSDEPKIILYFMPDYRVPGSTNRYLGFFYENGLKRRVLTTQRNAPGFSIHDVDILVDFVTTYMPGASFASAGTASAGSSILSGSHRIVGEELHLNLTAHSRERLGIRTIIFRQIEDYEPINPDEWFPDNRLEE